VAVTLADLREDITLGQAVARYTLEGLVDGQWRDLSRGETIGYRKLDRLEPVTVSGVRVRVDEAVGEVGPITVGLYGGGR
jgi:alpha-L-fucosidase